MANCPKCGSSHIQLDSSFDKTWGSTVVGWALFGTVGAAVGAMSEATKQKSVVCLSCGNLWQPSDLYVVTETIKETLGYSVDLVESCDRTILEAFMIDIGPVLEWAKKERTRATEIENGKLTVEVFETPEGKQFLSSITHDLTGRETLSILSGLVFALFFIVALISLFSNIAAFIGSLILCVPFFLIWRKFDPMSLSEHMTKMESMDIRKNRFRLEQAIKIRAKVDSALKEALSAFKVKHGIA